MGLRSVQFKEWHEEAPRRSDPSFKRKSHEILIWDVVYLWSFSSRNERGVTSQSLVSEDTDMTPFPSAAWQTGQSPSIYFMKASLASFDL